MVIYAQLLKCKGPDLTEVNGAAGKGPLAGLRVLDLSMIVAGGTASSLMADFGAEVVKVERPGGGDPLRNWGPFANGVSLWWKVHSRNKKSVTLNLGNAEGQGILKDLAAKADALIEGFRPGVMERWGLGPDDLLAVNPRLVMLRYSGFGQTGPYKDRPGFGTIAECMSGYVGMTGFQDTPPVLPPVPLADEVAGVFGAMAGMMALYHRDAGGSGKGQVVDVSLFEPLFRLCIPHVTMFDLLGINRERVGNDFPDAAPRSLYRTGDERWLGLSATSQSTFEGLARAMGMPDLIDRPAFVDNASRIENREELNDELNGWLGGRDRWTGDAEPVDTRLAAWSARSMAQPTSWMTRTIRPARTSSRSTTRSWATLGCLASCPSSARPPARWSTPAPPWGSTTPPSTAHGWGWTRGNWRACTSAA